MSQPPPERIDPHTESIGILSHHLVRYAFACELLHGGSCLDVGCGTGYGSASLATKGEYVIGVDLDRGAIRTAADRYHDVAFAQADAEALSFQSGSFDMVVCFEAIEHLRLPEAHLQEVVRVLRREGTYIVSTPLAGTGGSPEINPFHAREFSEDEFTRLLKKYFNNVEVLGQKRQRSPSQAALRRFDLLDIRKWRRTRPLVRAISRALGTRPTEEALVEDFSIGPISAETTEMIAVCRSPSKEDAL